MADARVMKLLASATGAKPREVGRLTVKDGNLLVHPKFAVEVTCGPHGAKVVLAVYVALIA